MEIEWSIKNIIIFLFICFIIVNVIFVFVIILEKIKNYEYDNLSKTQNQRKLIDYLKANVNFNNTYEISNNEGYFKLYCWKNKSKKQIQI